MSSARWRDARCRRSLTTTDGDGHHATKLSGDPPIHLAMKRQDSIHAVNLTAAEVRAIGPARPRQAAVEAEAVSGGVFRATRSGECAHR
jgi:hypothetical protein